MVSAALVGGALVQWLQGEAVAQAQETETGKVIEVRAVRLVDADGQERGVLGVQPEGVALVLKDAEGRPRVGLGLTSVLVPAAEPYWVVAFIDAEGVDRLSWGARDDGVACGGHVTDADGVLRIGLGADPGGVGITLNDESGQERLGVGLSPGGGGDFVAKDQDGNDLWRALGDVGPMP
jgi:hypothetical protein